MSDLMMQVHGWLAAITWSPLFMPLVGPMGGAVVSAGLYLKQRRNSSSLPALPSCVEGLEGEGDAGTRFFSAVHDLTMTVTEAWNVTWLRGGRIEERIDRRHLQEVSERVRSGADELLDVLSDYVVNEVLLAEAKLTLETLWTYESYDHYVTETYYVTSTDSNGNSTSKKKTRQVYSSTDHTFTYSRWVLPGAEAAVSRWLEAAESATFPSLNLHERKVNLLNLDATQRSFVERLVKTTITRSAKKVEPWELEVFLNQWLLGTRIDADLRQVVQGVVVMKTLGDAPFRTTENSKASYKFNTTSRTDEGPEGYRAIQRLLAPMKGGGGAWAKVLAVIEGSKERALKLEEFAMDSEIVESDREYAQLAVELYKVAFPSSKLQLDRLVDYWVVGLGGAFAMAFCWVAAVVLRFVL